MSIRNFEQIKSHLVDALALPEGPAFMIVNQIYIGEFTGGDFKLDPMDRLEFCRLKLPSFSKFMKILRRCRNALMHRNIFSEDLWWKIYYQVEHQVQKPGNAGMMFEYLWHRL